MTGRGAARQVGAGRKGVHVVGADHPVARSLFSGTLEDAPRGENLDVAMTPKRRRVRVVGGDRPVARSLFSGTLEDAPRGENLDVAMTPKRRRVRVVRADRPVARSLFSGTLEGAPRGENLDVAMTPKRRRVFQQPSTSRFLEVSGSASSMPASGAFTSRPVVRPRVRHSLEQSEIEASLCYAGSDNDGSGDDEDWFGVIRQSVDAGEEEEAAFYHVEVPKLAPELAAERDAQLTEQVAGQAAGPFNPFDFDWRTPSDVAIDPQERREEFNQHPGSFEHHETPYDAFIAIWDRDVMEHIARETNLYAQQLTEDLMTQGQLGPRSRMNEWTDTTVDELYVWMAVTQAMGVVYKGTYESYWSKNEDIFETPGFKVQMSLRRFQHLNRCIHFNDNRSVDLQALPPSEARVFKIKPIIDHLNQKFKHMFQMGQNIALDESLMQWKGSLSMKQYIRTKAAQVGIKTFEVCDTHTGYLYCFDVHTGAAQPTPGVPVQNLAPVESTIPALVLKLLNDLQFQGHTVWMDNYYNSPTLARTMKSMGFDCVGTLRTNRTFVPTQLSHLTKANMRRGEMKSVTSGDIDIVVFKDQNLVALISTFHGDAVKDCGGILKPIVVLDYNINMGGVDKKDQMLAEFRMERKRTQVWYKKFFRRLLNVSILNSWVLWRHSPRGMRSMEHREFRIALVNALLKKHSSSKPWSGDNTLPAQASAKFPQSYIDHFPVATNMGPSGKRNRLICAVCKKRVSTMCPVCKVGLCSGTFRSCAGVYHTK